MGTGRIPMPRVWLGTRPSGASASPPSCRFGCLAARQARGIVDLGTRVDHEGRIQDEQRKGQEVAVEAAPGKKQGKGRQDQARPRARAAGPPVVGHGGGQRTKLQGGVQCFWRYAPGTRSARTEGDNTTASREHGVPDWSQNAGQPGTGCRYEVWRVDERKH